MCGRFTLTSSPAELRREFLLADWPAERRPRYNIAPTQDVAALRGVADERHLAWLRWGLVPAWATDVRVGARMINARGETVAAKPAFRSAFRRRRCLVLADGFYEWRAEPDGKVPVWVHRRDGAPFAFAGIWERCERAGEEPIESCAIITGPADAFMQPVHDRMPVILGREQRERWLEDAPEAELLKLLRATPSADLQMHAVSRLVNSPRNDVPACCAPV
jgi:putative SOS response-associated peptidase YedK